MTMNYATAPNYTGASRGMVDPLHMDIANGFMNGAPNQSDAFKQQIQNSNMAKAKYAAQLASVNGNPNAIQWLENQGTPKIANPNNPAYPVPTTPPTAVVPSTPMRPGSNQGMIPDGLRMDNLMAFAQTPAGKNLILKLKQQMLQHQYDTQQQQQKLGMGGGR